MRFFTLILLFTSFQFSIASELVTDKETTLEGIAIDFHQKFNRDERDYLEDLKKWNPKWVKGKIPLGQDINIRYPFSPYLGYGSISDIKSAQKSENFRLNIGFAASYGSFTQNGNTLKINFKQNSPATIQIMANDQIEKNIFIDGSMYLSKIMDAKVSGANNGETKIPYDFGANIYVGRFLFDKQWAFYGGYDFERFYLFDMNKLETQNEVEIHPSNLHYGTVGIKYFSKNYFAKLSSSLEIISNSNIASNISGKKWIISAGKNITKEFGTGIFIKNHSLYYDGKKVEATRFGLSLFSTL